MPFSSKVFSTSVRTARAPLPPQAPVAPKRVQLLRRVAESPGAVGDLGVGGEDESVRAAEGEYDGHD